MNRSGMFRAFFVQFLLCFPSGNAKTTARGLTVVFAGVTGVSVYEKLL